MTINALFAADELIVPFKPEEGSRKGISLLLSTINDVKDLNKNIRIAGFVVVMYDKRRKKTLNENIDFIEDVARQNGTTVFTSKIRLSASATKITKEDIFTPNTAVSEDYAALVEEFLEKENKK